DVGLAEDFGLGLAREGDVVRLGLRLLAQVRGLLLERLGLRDGALDRPLAVAPDERAEAVCGELAATPAVVRVEEVREGGSERDQPEAARLPRHLSRPSRSRATCSRARSPASQAPRRARRPLSEPPERSPPPRRP